MAVVTRTIVYGNCHGPKIVENREIVFLIVGYLVRVNDERERFTGPPPHLAMIEHATRTDARRITESESTKSGARVVNFFTIGTGKVEQSGEVVAAEFDRSDSEIVCEVRFEIGVSYKAIVIFVVVADFPAVVLGLPSQVGSVFKQLCTKC